MRRALRLCIACALWLAAPAARAALLEAGGPTALPAQTTAPVALANPGFEEGWHCWTPPSAAAFSLAGAPDAHSGQKCLRLDCAAATPYTPRARQSLKDAGPGVYVLRFWVKTRGVGGGQGTQGARVSIEYLLQGGQRAWPSTRVFQGTADWRQEELRAYIPPALKPGSVVLSLHRYGSASAGEAFFDDVSLERAVPPPLEAFLLYPNYRGFLPADSPQRVRLWVRAHGPPGNRVSVEATAEGGRVVSSASLGPMAEGEQSVEMDAAAWPPGRYRVEARRGEYRCPVYVVQKIPAEAWRGFPLRFDANQVLSLEGRPTFPIGLYNTLAKFGTLDQADLDRVEEMAETEAALYVNYWAWPLNVAERRRYLGEMRRHGAWFLDTINNVFPGLEMPAPSVLDDLLPGADHRLADQPATDRYLTRLAETMRDVPGHAGWYVMDERDFGEVPRTFHQYQVLRAADPLHPTFGVSNKPAELFFWRDAVDVFGLDPYPLFNMKAGRPLSEVGEWTRAGVEAVRGSRPVWMVLQFFQGWSTDRWPTEAELRTMSLMAIAEGARGIFYWSYGNRALGSVRDPAVREGYRQRLLKVTAELKRLEPALVAPDAPGAVKSVSDPRIRWRARVAGGQTYVFAYLPSERFVESAPATDVRFELAGGQAVTRAFRPDSAEWFSVP